MTFLSKLAAAVLKGCQIVLGFGPVIAAAYPQTSGAMAVVSTELTQLASVIQQAELFGQALQLPGDKKLVAAAPAFAQVILQSSLMVGKKISDPAQFNAAVAGMASNMADLLNALHPNVDTVDKTA